MSNRIHLRCKRCDKGSHTVDLDANRINLLYQRRFILKGSVVIDEKDIIDFLHHHMMCPLYILSEQDHEPIYLCSPVQ